MLLLKSHVIFKWNGDGGVILDKKSGQYWQLNQNGAFCLQKLIEGRIEAEIAIELSENYAVSVEQATRDIVAIKEAVCAAGLAEPS